MSRLKDKAAIVTGAGSGIGRATALRFAKEGAHVLLAGRRQSTVAQVAEEIRGFGGNAVALEVDVGIEEQVRDMIDATLSAFGRIDILFNNAVHSAASSEPSERDLMAFDTSVFERIVRVNVLGGVWACKYALPHMLARGMGAILFTSSTSAFAGDVGQFSYGASKAMVNWYIKTIATTFGKQGIRCNGIVPGLIQTPALEAWITPEVEEGFLRLNNVPRLGKPDDIAGVAAFLASEEAEYVNGSLYFADGGMTASLPFAQLQRESSASI